MARELNEIKNSITEAFMNDATLADKYGFPLSDSFENHFSKVSLENLIFGIVAFGIWTLEKLFDFHKKEVDTALKELKPHTARWYRNKALSFQYGFDLLPDSDRFNNDNLSEEEIDNSKIIKYSSVVEAQDESRLIIKIATEQDDELSPINQDQKESFTSYIQEVKDAGVRVTVINYEPDILKLEIRIFRDPLVLDSNGMSILTAKYPVQDALKAYMKELPFNGELVLQELANRLENTPGVLIVQIDSAQSKWIDTSTNGYGDFTGIDVRRIPESGYFKIEDFNGISYDI